MATKLLIVESPGKLKKLSQILGAGWTVEASRGHVRDLPREGELGVDLATGFTPTYRIPPDHASVVSRLRKQAAAAEAIYLASDPDREGEAIAWHLLEVLHKELKGKPVHRVTFTSITAAAVQAAVQNPRRLDMPLVEAQQARRIADRLMGWLVSPLACKALQSAVSAGRVQSVCLRLVVDRERDIAAFTPRTYWTLEAVFENGETPFTARLTAVQGKKPELADKSIVDKLMDGLQGAVFWVLDAKQGERPRAPLPPFTTSTLQQAASKAYGFAPEQTMQLAQKLYEEGRITYMRTDSVAVAPEAQAEAHTYIQQTYGAAYLPPQPPYYETKAANAQEAHEAIRPTHVQENPPGSAAGDLDRLYQLIWQRFVASQMAQARSTVVVLRIGAGKLLQQPYPVEFRAEGRQLVFEGFLKVYQEALDEGEEEETPELPIPMLPPSSLLTFQAWQPEAHTTQPPARYTEAALVQELERRGLGRPSTYATMVKAIKEKGYARLDKKRLAPTELGSKLCDFLLARFPAVVAYETTAELETELDRVAGGQITRLDVLTRFWEGKLRDPLRVLAQEIGVEVGSSPRQSKSLKVVGTCPKCGKRLVERMGSKGPFAGCEDYPRCRTTQPLHFQKAAGK